MGDTVSSLLFQPPPPTKLKEHKIIWLKTERGSRIPGFYIGYSGVDDKARSMTMDEVKRSNPEEGITLLYSHANAEDLGSIYPWCKFLSKMLQVNLFAYDYTGYGMAHKVDAPSEEHCYADVDAAYRFLRQELRIPNSNIVLYGRSLGSGPSCYLAAGTASESREGSEDGPVGGLILHAPFLSVYRIVLETGCTVYGDKFPNIDYAPYIGSPVMLVHGTADQIVPFNHSERLLEAVPPAHRAHPLFIEGMGHNNVHASVRPLFVERLVEYLDKHVWPGVENKGKRRTRTKSMQKKQVRVRLLKGQQSGASAVTDSSKEYLLPRR
mmetsp:Transcript_2110/g.3792  ORF Transcript_2110/g.3792 Transcript_2110/m.3792 type:complete len:324 (+) Transcript_2110:113-1084(+)|eukprot:CAMPEP_0202494042 /NCGR_PEP_ID=MMETSP1361-20130828/10500_1 /ASSEMBLY_ACC=CAM_ASM_000849 /TAXON_ID=210615 /ORGANISM="Staurosira complex sp., Strain CCMP2646" /LENGTH=323 /DNA_ID=CAMNT_0049124437 /DNA_START=93 /DNA_END=1064 /DNA_ORIENTATION=-